MSMKSVIKCTHLILVGVPSTNRSLAGSTTYLLRFCWGWGTSMSSGLTGTIRFHYCSWLICHWRCWGKWYGNLLNGSQCVYSCNMLLIWSDTSLKAFCAKNVTATEREALGILHGLETLLLHKIGIHNHWPQTPSYNIQERCGYTIAMTIIHPAQDTPIQKMHTVQDRAWPTHSWMAIKTKPHRRQR